MQKDEKYALNYEITQVKPRTDVFSWKKTHLGTGIILVFCFYTSILLFHNDILPYLLCQDWLVQPKI